MNDNKQFWERMARFYAPIQEKSNAALYAAVCAHCRPYLTPTARVLEVGCGSGQLTIPLAPLAGEWLATDFSERMLAEARHRCPAMVQFALEDVTALRMEDASFDVAIIANTLHIIPAPEQALKELHRVLRPDGFLIAPTFVYEGTQSRSSRLRMWATEKLGFKTYCHWNLQDLADFVTKGGFQVVERSLLPGDPIPEGFVVARKC